MKTKSFISLFLLLVLFMTGCTSIKNQNSVNVLPRQNTETTPVSIKTEIESENTPNVTEKLHGYDFESTWGDLVAYEGEMVWDTLTREQQAMVHYPKLDMNKVFWVPNGKSYHAVDWCYTLSKSKDIRQGTLSEALRLGLEPCSKCVGN